MGLRTRIAEMIGGKDLLQESQRQTQEIVKDMFGAYLDGPWEVDPGMLIERLKEYDSAALIDLLHDTEYERMAGLYSNDNQGRRDRQVKESQRMWFNSPLATWTINVWTSYGLGESVKVQCDDEKAQQAWDECVLRSDVFDTDKIHELSNWVLVDGNIFLVQFISVLDGETTWDMLDADEVIDIIKDEMTGKPIWYKRQFTTRQGNSKTWYYPNAELYLSDKWPENAEALLPTGATTTDTENPNTIALVLHIAHNRKDKKSGWGWPILGVTSPYMRAHKEFVENRLTVSRNKASAVREYTTKGGSRGVAALKAKLNSTLSATNSIDKNPGMPAGSELIHNDAVSMKDLSMNTGASDAKNDNEMFAWLALIGAGLFPTSAGMDTSRWATAVAMDKTQSTQWTRYQTFWSTNIKRIVELTLKASERWGSATFTTYGATVSIDSLTLADFADIVAPISQMVSSMKPFVDDGVMPEEAAKKILQNVWLILLQSLGINDAAEIVSNQSFGIAMPTEKAEAFAELRRISNMLEKDTRER
jgi:hypothetical protein